MKFTRQQIVTGLFAAGLLLLAWMLRSVIAYFLVAMIVAFIGAPLNTFLDKHLRFRKKPLPSALNAAIVLLAFVGVFVLFSLVVIPPLMEQTSAIANISDQDFNKSFGQPMNDIRKKLTDMGVPASQLSVENFKQKIENYLSFTTVSDLAATVVGSLTSTVGWVFSVLFISFFFLKDKFLIYRLIYILTPDKYEPKMQRILRSLNDMIGRYFRSVLLQILVFGTYIFVGLTLAGEKYALTVAVFSGLINLVSYIGPLLGVSFALIFCVLSHIGADFYTGIYPEMFQVIAVYAVAVLLDNFFSYPLIFSKSLKVHPLELFFVILAGAQLGGLGGMMLAAPVYTVVRIVAKEFLSGFEIVQSVTKHL